MDVGEECGRCKYKNLIFSESCHQLIENLNGSTNWPSQVSNVIEEVLRIYSKLNSWQRNDARADIPRAALQMLTTMKMHIDVQVLSSCILFLSVIFEEHSDMFSMCTDIILSRILVSVKK